MFLFNTWFKRTEKPDCSPVPWCHEPCNLPPWATSQLGAADPDRVLAIVGLLHLWAWPRHFWPHICPNKKSEPAQNSRIFNVWVSSESGRFLNPWPTCGSFLRSSHLSRHILWHKHIKHCLRPGQWEAKRSSHHHEGKVPSAPLEQDLPLQFLQPRNPYPWHPLREGSWRAKLPNRLSASKCAN